MSTLRELEDKISQYGSVQPFSVIISEVLRTQDYPVDAQLYLNVVAAYTEYYERKRGEKAYAQEMKEVNDEDNESEAD